VFVPMHYREAAANLLTNPALDPYAGIPEFKVCAVKLSPVRDHGEEAAVTASGDYERVVIPNAGARGAGGRNLHRPD
jgi:predicted molibdopterin-dependent oxidoreductase YjgC